MFSQLVDLLFFVKFSLRQIHSNHCEYWVNYARFLLVSLLLCVLGASVCLSYDFLQNYKKDMEGSTAMTFYLSPTVPDPIRDHLLVELQERPYVTGVDFMSSRQGQEVLTKFIGVESLNHYLDQDPLPSKVKVFFKPKARLDLLRNFMQELKASNYVQHLKFDAQNWILFQGQSWFIEFFAPLGWLVIMVFSWLNVRLCLEQCFISSRWANIWWQMGMSLRKLRGYVFLSLIIMPVSAFLVLKVLINILGFKGFPINFDQIANFGKLSHYLVLNFYLQMFLIALTILVDVTPRKITNN